MWKDSNDKIAELYFNLQKIEKFPAECPICKEQGGHIYMHIYDEKTRRGGIWIWCSECHSFFHGSIRVTKYWINYSHNVLEKLSAIPTYLDGIKDKIDQHTMSVVKKCINKVT